MIAAWLESLGYRAEIEWAVDTERRSRARVADVMGLDPATGQRFGFEIQYAPLTVTDWHKRTTEYGEAGIPVTWLFGHTGEHMVDIGRRGDGRVRVDPEGAAGTAGMNAGRAPTMWLNPTLQVSAVPVTTKRDRQVPARMEQGELLELPLSDCVIRDGRIWHPAFDELIDAEQWVRGEDRRERHEQRERDAAAEAARRAAEAERQRRMDEAASERARRRASAQPQGPEGSQRSGPGGVDDSAEPHVDEAGIWQGKPGWADITNPTSHATVGSCDVCGADIPEPFASAGMVRHVFCAFSSGKVYRRPAHDTQPGLFDPS